MTDLPQNVRHFGASLDNSPFSIFLTWRTLRQGFSPVKLAYRTCIC